ncbi:hypothetical protein [Ahrensia kielensis]|uniref:hypothetical protein n=1 Tax=Ahrensia kielensis TaxID=76980 RepID=UPI00036E8AB0|nr:hypothetical protein [Ahrensia kielensis]
MASNSPKKSSLPEKNPAIRKKALSASPKKAEIERKINSYNAAVDAAMLKSVQLVEINFLVKPDFFRAKSNEKKFHVVVDSVEPEYEAGNDAVVALVDFEVFIKRARTKQLTCKAKYAVVYGGFSNCEYEDVLRFIERVSTFTCYPYFRSVFANIDWAAGTHLPPLPVLKERVLPSKNSK